MDTGLRTAAIAAPAVVMGVCLAVAAPSAQQVSAPVVSGARLVSASQITQAQDVMTRSCLGCHNDRALRGNLSLEGFEVGRAHCNAAVAEKVIRKLQAGLMPPAGAPRPEAAALENLTEALKTGIDTAAAKDPNPGRRTFQRLNRAEYRRSVRDLLSIDVDVAAFLPPDTISHGFDNIADVQTLSPTLMGGYLRAASQISREALGDPDAGPSDTTYKVARTASQMRHVEGAPFGTRGGVSVVRLFGSPNAEGEQIEVSIDGERVALLNIDPFISESDPAGLNLQTVPLAVRAGSHRVSAAFIQRFAGPVDDVIAPIEHTLADSQIGVAYGITTLPHLRDLSVSGPYNVTGVSDTPTRRRIFTCRPTSLDGEMACATEIISWLATRAYRRPLTDADLDGLMGFYEHAAAEGDFESGVRAALRAMLASPHFVFRLEQAPSGVRVGQNYRVTGLELASRLSFFLWGTAPDDELVARAGAGRFDDRALEDGVLEREARRMLADPRAEALGTRFAALWLRLQDLDRLFPDALRYPQYDKTLADSMRRETELFFAHIVREDRSVLELLTADYTFVNERLAQHYGIPNVAGHRFRRVMLTDENRRGLLGDGSVLASTSFADRSSPVNRGKWVMEVLLGSPPPPPPPNVPDFDDTAAVSDGRRLSVRERMEQHRSNPVCASCHRVIDPIGLSLEHFDVTGKWRIKDNGVPIDASSELYDSTPLDGPADLREALLTKTDTLVTTFTENLMAYALGRRIEYYDMPTIRSIVRDAKTQDYRILSFILGIVASDAFQMSRADSLESSGD